MTTDPNPTSRGLEQAETQHHLFDPLRRLADSVPHVVWITQLHPERVIYVSPSFESIWGRAPQELYDDPRLWTACIHPEDRARVEEAFVGWITGSSRQCQKLEYRVLQPSGAQRWVTDHGVVTPPTWTERGSSRCAASKRSSAARSRGSPLASALTGP